MHEVVLFPSRFYMIENAVSHQKLMNVLNTIKTDTDYLAASVNADYGPTYKTNFSFKDVHGKLFDPIIEEIKGHLVKDYISFEVSGAPWYAEYGEHDYHEPHIHATTCPVDDDRVFQKGENYYNYSGIICLSNFGETTFLNPNTSSFVRGGVKINSEFNKVVLFPSNIHHFVTPHGLKDKVRAVFSFNCILNYRP